MLVCLSMCDINNGIRWLNVNYNLVKIAIRDRKKISLNHTGVTVPFSLSTDHPNFSMLITYIS